MENGHVIYQGQRTKDGQTKTLTWQSRTGERWAGLEGRRGVGAMTSPRT